MYKTSISNSSYALQKDGTVQDLFTQVKAQARKIRTLRYGKIDWSTMASDLLHLMCFLANFVVNTCFIGTFHSRIG